MKKIKHILFVGLLIYLLSVPFDFSYALGVNRIYGEDRYSTAVRISETTFSTADSAFLVNGDKPIDALMAQIPAIKMGSPILLVKKSILPNSVKAELSRLKVKNIYVIGGEDSIDSSVISKLSSEYKIARLSGSNRYVTSENISKFLGSTDFAFINGHNFVDAIAAAPFISTVGKGDITYKLYQQGDEEKQSGRGMIFIGGDSVLPRFEEESFRIYGESRYETAVNIAQSYNSSMVGQMDKRSKKIDKVYLVNGTNYLDGITVGTKVSSENSCVLLIEKDNIPDEVKKYLADYNIKQVTIIGGTNSISKNIEDQLNK